MSKPVVTINYNSSLESFYNGIREMLNARYHSGGLACDPSGNYTPTAAELTQQGALSSHAAHAGDGIEIRGNHAYQNGVDLGDIERLIK